MTQHHTSFLFCLLAMYSLPYILMRVTRSENYIPLVVWQIFSGILLSPGVFGIAQPEIYSFIFTPEVINALHGLSMLGVMIFIMVAGIELDLLASWKDKKESFTISIFALLVPLSLGCIAAIPLSSGTDWRGVSASNVSFTLAIGMTCSITALPVLIIIMEKLSILTTDLGRRVLRCASADDIAIWVFLAVILADFSMIGKQILFIFGFMASTFFYRRLMIFSQPANRFLFALIWLILAAYFSDIAGLHYMVGAFLAGVVTDAHWFENGAVDKMRENILLTLMPAYFISTGLRTSFDSINVNVVSVALFLLLVSILGKHLGVRLSFLILGKPQRDTVALGWLLQTKSLVMIVFCSILLDRGIFTSNTFSALLLMALCSTALTLPMTRRALRN